MVLSRRGNATRVSNAARVACDINTCERVVMDGRSCPHPLPRWAGTPSCRSIGERGPEEVWVVEKNPNQDECGSHVSVFLLCHVHDQRAQPYLGCSPTHCCDQIQSSVPKNNIKSKHEGFETSGVGGVGWGVSLPLPSVFSQSKQMECYWKTAFLRRDPAALWSGCILFPDVICTVQFCVTCVSFCLSLFVCLTLSGEVFDTSEKAHLQKAAFRGW